MNTQRMDAFRARFDVAATLVGVEVGVFEGEGAESLLMTFPRLRLFLVDPYEASDRYMSTGDPTAPLVSERLCRAVQRRLEPFDARVVWRVMPSVDAAALFESASLDFAFIDAEHTYEAVMADAAAWWPKIKPGGWLCGHDFGLKAEHAHHVVGVEPAVREFVSRVKLPLEYYAADGDYTWWVRKP